MPEVNPPDDPGSPAQQGDKATNPPPQLDAGDAAVAQAKIALAANTPYVWGGNGPPGPNGGFDCSGLIVWCYMTGAQITIPRTVAAMWNGGPLATVWDQPVQEALALSEGQNGAQLDMSLLIPGDLIIYLDVGAGGSDGHVKIYIGDSQTIEAPHPGAIVVQNPVNTSENDDGAFRGVRRVSGEANAGSAGTSGGGGGGGDNSDPNANSVTVPPAGWYQLGAGDPRDNLPFSAFFLGQQIVGGPSNPASPVAGRGGSLTVQFQGGKGTSMPGVTLVRGGMGELTPTGSGYSPRPGGPFRCFFMMNPSTLSSTATIDTSGTATPFSQSQAVLQAATYPMQNQSYSFTIMFNRMYEVWQGNMVGPSQLGVRWDVRAIERLMGQYDATQNLVGTKTSGTIGEGNYGPGDYPPQSLPIQVILGGPNSIQFQGVIVQMDVTYTMFSSDMIPVECQVDIGIMRLYLPQMVGSNLLNILDRGAFLQQGKPVTGLNPGHTFNPNPGTAGPGPINSVANFP